MKYVITLAAFLLFTFLVGGVLSSGAATADPETAGWRAGSDDGSRSDLPPIADAPSRTPDSPGEEFVDTTMGVAPADRMQSWDSGGFAVLFVDEQASSEIRIDELIGTPVIGVDGKEVATIRDLVLDRDYRLSAVVLSSGGLFGFGEREVAMRPYNLTLRWSPEGYSAFVNLTRDELDDAPEFKPLAGDIAPADFGGVLGFNILMSPIGAGEGG